MGCASQASENLHPEVCLTGLLWDECHRILNSHDYLVSNDLSVQGEVLKSDM